MIDAGTPPRLASRSGPRGNWLVIAAPYAWLLVFFLAPFALVLKISLSQSALSQPPYAPALDWSDDLHTFWEKLSSLSFEPFRGLFEDSLYVQSYVSSVLIAAIATLLTLLVAYPFAFAIVRSSPIFRAILLGLAVAPFWTSFLIRVYAWIAILKDEGLLNHFLRSIGLTDAPLGIFATNTAVVIGIVYSYLPFMLLPLYAAIEGQDPALLEAAADLGASPWRAFCRITLPLSARGIMAGCLLVFIPAVGEFVIPDLLGGSDTLMIGRTLWNDFFLNRDWPTASAAAIVLLILLVGPLLVYERLQLQDEGRRA
ncbi:MAG: putrescine transport system permease protein [Methylobacteriaceae bacterium]|nr:putrescine transport system permease protein [Methylobacteriaceae bacterium]